MWHDHGNFAMVGAPHSPCELEQLTQHSHIAVCLAHTALWFLKLPVDAKLIFIDFFLACMGPRAKKACPETFSLGSGTIPTTINVVYYPRTLAKAWVSSKAKIWINLLHWLGCAWGNRSSWWYSRACYCGRMGLTYFHSWPRPLRYYPCVPCFIFIRPFSFQSQQRW